MRTLPHPPTHTRPHKPNTPLGACPTSGMHFLACYPPWPPLCSSELSHEARHALWRVLSEADGGVSGQVDAAVHAVLGELHAEHLRQGPSHEPQHAEAGKQR